MFTDESDHLYIHRTSSTPVTTQQSTDISHHSSIVNSPDTSHQSSLIIASPNISQPSSTVIRTSPQTSDPSSIVIQSPNSSHQSTPDKSKDGSPKKQQIMRKNETDWTQQPKKGSFTVGAAPYLKKP